MNQRSNITTLLCLFMFLNTAFSQETSSSCAYTPEKKAQGLFEKGTDKRKYKKQERLKFLKDAIERDPNYLDALFEYSSQSAHSYLYTKKPFPHLEKYLLKIEEKCPDYHADVYYFLGQHYLNNEEYKKAISYLNTFLSFESEDESKFSRNHEKYLEGAKDDVHYAEFYGEVFKNPVPFDPVLVEQVSTEADEYLPLITADNEELFYTRRTIDNSKIKNTSFALEQTPYIERFTESKRQGSGFNGGGPLPYPFNTDEESNYGGASVSLDSKHLFVTICKQTSINGRDYKNCDIYTCDYVLEYDEATGQKTWHWGELRNMGPNINRPDSWEAQPSISSDGKTLFFASARKESLGIDIYVSQKDATGQWKPAINLGEPINTEKNDKSPFIHSDSQTLYYASQGHLGFGGYDVFYTRFENGKWQKPKNIGFPINSEKDEHGFVINTAGDKVFYSSDINQDKGKGLDIFTFELYEEARPQKVMLVKGKVNDEKGNIPKDATVEVKNTNTKEVSQVKVDENDGSYAAIVKVNAKDPVVVNVKSQGKVFSSQLISSANRKDVVQKVETTVEEIQIGKPFKIHDIYYATNSSEINKESKLILDEFADYLKENSTMKIAIYGHTDNMGAENDNLALSADRAFNVLGYLQEKGVNPSNVTFKGFGESKPIASNDTPEGRAKNRRTEFVILSK